MSHQSDFRDFCSNVGLDPGALINDDGRILRFDVEGQRKGRKNGWAVLHDWGGIVGDWKEGRREVWRASGETETFDREALKKQRAERLAKKERDHAKASAEASQRWSKALEPNGKSHPYLDRKGVGPHGTRVEGDLLLVPVVIGGKVASVQVISADGTKKFHYGAPVAGGCYPVGPKPSETTGPIVIAEGFSTSATVAEATGFPVLCSFDAGNMPKVAKWAKAQWPNREFIIAADDDHETEGNPGLTAGAEAAKLCAGRLVSPDMQGAEGTDFNDQASTYGLADVCATFDQIPPAPSPETLPLINPADWHGERPPARDWRLEGLIPNNQATLLTGAGAAGKSLLMQQFNTCVGMGRELLGVTAYGCPSLYITCEDDADELHRRQASICEALNIPLDSTRGRVFLLSRQGEPDNALASFGRDGKMTVGPFYLLIRDSCRAFGIKHTTLDNSAHFFSGNENDRHQVAAFINLCNRLAIEIGGSVVLVGHPNKAGDSYSGSTAWENQVRSRLFLEVPKAEDGTALNPDARILRNEKANYAQRGSEITFMWYRGAFVPLSAIPEAERDEMDDNALAGAHNDIFLKCLDTLVKQQRATSASPNASNFAPKMMVSMTEAKGMKIGHLRAAMERLFHLERIGANQELWRNPKDRKLVTGINRI